MKKFLMFSSYLPSILNFRGDLIAAIADRGYEIHILAPDLEQFSEDHDKLMNLSYYVHSVPMQRVGTNPVADVETVIAVLRLIR
ncbi:glycosyltransferase family 1 protein, partial [Psychrobacter sp. F1192]|nr:glycosyltransferase family 1 protein [Psychrobacter coccoides]